MIKEQLQKVNDLLNEMVATEYVAGANCLILQNGQEQGYFEVGYADLEEKRPIDRKTIFLLYSMTKPITSGAAMCLLEQGKLDLLDPVEKYLPGFKNQMVWQQGKKVPAIRPVTIKDLLSMTSGLVYGDGDEVGQEMERLLLEIGEQMLNGKVYTTVEAANLLGQCPLAFQPGTHWRYGTSADVLGAIIEVVSEMPLGTFMKRAFFDPLEMADTGFSLDDSQRKRLSKVYEGTTEGLKHYTTNHLGVILDMSQKPTIELGGAGLVGTIDDYAHYAQMLLNGGTWKDRRILGKQTVKYMTSCYLQEGLTADLASWESLAGYSYGNLMRVMKEPGLAVYNTVADEYGWDGWLGTYFVNDPRNQMSLIFMQQRPDSGTTAYTRRLRNIVAAAL